MLHYYLLLPRGSVALERFHLRHKCSRQLVVGSLSEVLFLKTFGVGEAICEPHIGNVGRSHLSFEHCLNLISGFHVLDEREHEFDPYLVGTFAPRTCITNLVE